MSFHVVGQIAERHDVASFEVHWKYTSSPRNAERRFLQAVKAEAGQQDYTVGLKGST